jgi:hypothetical protein
MTAAPPGMTAHAALARTLMLMMSVCHMDFVGLLASGVSESWIAAYASIADRSGQCGSIFEHRIDTSSGTSNRRDTMQKTGWPHRIACVGVEGDRIYGPVRSIGQHLADDRSAAPRPTAFDFAGDGRQN